MKLTKYIYFLGLLILSAGAAIQDQSAGLIILGIGTIFYSIRKALS